MPVRIAVLMYHEVAGGDRFDEQRRRTHPDYILPAESFAWQMNWLAANGFQTLTARQLVRAVASGAFERLPRRAVLLTFDDGFAGNYLEVLPVLQERRQVACFAITVQEIGRSGMMRWTEVGELARARMEIASHLYHHVAMERLSWPESQRELFNSRMELEARLGIPVPLLTLPHGSYRRGYEVLAQECGYMGGFSSQPGFVGPDSNPFLLERIPVLRGTSREAFIRAVTCQPQAVAGARVRRQVHRLLGKLVGEETINKFYHKLNRITQPHGA